MILKNLKFSRIILKNLVLVVSKDLSMPAIVYSILYYEQPEEALFNPDFTTEGMLSKTLMQLQDSTLTKNNKKFAN